MKNKLYILVSFLLILISCSEEGPFTMGKIDCDIQESSVTPTTALVSVTLPKNDKGLFKGVNDIWLSDTPINNLNEYKEKVKEFIKKGNGNSSADGYSYEKLFTDLQPNTTYYVLVSLRVNYNEGSSNNYWDYERDLYCPGYSFTTSKEGDYSIMGDVTCEVVEAFPGYVKTKVVLPDDLEFDSSNCILEASTSSDMSEVVESEQLYRLNGKEAECIFKDLTNGKYYLRLHGDFRLLREYNISISDIALDIPKPIDIANLNLQCDVDYVGENFSIFRITMPQNMTQSWSADDWDKNQLTWSCGNIVNSEDRKYNDSGLYRYVYIPRKFQNGDEISFRISGVFEYYISGYGHYKKYLEFDSNFKFISSEAIISDPSFEILFDGMDYSIIKLIYSNNMTFEDYNILKYYVSYGNASTDSYESISGLSNYIVINTNPDIDSERFFHLEVDFKYHGIQIESGIINIEGGLKPSSSNQKLFNISTQQNKDDLKISISCPDNFHFEYYYDVKLDCRLSSENEDVVFSGISYSYNSSSKSTIVFSINKDKLEKLRKGEKYILTISGFNLLYGSEYINNSSDSFNLNWVYQ